MGHNIPLGVSFALGLGCTFRPERLLAMFGIYGIHGLTSILALVRCSHRGGPVSTWKWNSEGDMMSLLLSNSAYETMTKLDRRVIFAPSALIFTWNFLGWVRHQCAGK